ncbi:MAG: flagellar basal body rod protein FlgC [Chloroflexota bacterium]|jgi:flagellar basal-body rod protein FlgC
MSLTSSMRISASSLTAQRLRMDVVASNLANVSTTRTPEGGPYRRREVVLGAAYSPNRGVIPVGGRSVSPIGVRVLGITDHEQIRLVSDPSHPDADENGDVAYPDIDLVHEMGNMLSAVRAYEASVTAINAAKNMAQKALELGRV